VCIKQILDPDIPLALEEDTGWVRAEKMPVYRMNHYDEFALEEAIRIREAFAGTIIEAVSFGLQRAVAVLRRALELGADEAMLLRIVDEHYVTPFETAMVIASYVKKQEYDLIFTGIMAEDDLQGQTGQILAALLGIPCATSVVEETVDSDARFIHVVQEREEGRRASLSLTLPALITVQSGINRPRYPALSHVLRARSRDIPTVPIDMHKLLPKEKTLSLTKPSVLNKGICLEGGSQEKAQRFLEICHEHGLL
jgi:electron transfer flavoprotein beta subunit